MPDSGSNSRSIVTNGRCKVNAAVSPAGSPQGGCRRIRWLDEYYDSAEARRKRVDGMFDAGAKHYDWINGLMSFGSGRRYRSDALKRHGLAEGQQVLDVGSGTGVLALIAQETVGDQGRVVALDPSTGMLTQARANGVNSMVTGLAESLPFPDRQFDMLTMGYALRHVADLEQTFVEYRRVLKSGGKVLLLEITRHVVSVVVAGCVRTCAGSCRF